MDNIKISANAYSQFYETYLKLHEDILESAEYCYKEVYGLLHAAEGFHADMTSEKLESMLEVWDNSILPYIRAGFSETEKNVQEYLSAMQEKDRL